MRIHVRQRADRYNVIGAPKTAASRRVVPFGKVVGTTLKAWKLSPAVQERMGHSSITVTMDTYGHLFPRGDDSKVLDGTGRITWDRRAEDPFAN